MAKEEDHSKYVLLIVGLVVVFAIISLLFGSQKPKETLIGEPIKVTQLQQGDRVTVQVQPTRASPDCDQKASPAEDPNTFLKKSKGEEFTFGERSLYHWSQTYNFQEEDPKSEKSDPSTYPYGNCYNGRHATITFQRHTIDISKEKPPKCNTLSSLDESNYWRVESEVVIKVKGTENQIYSKDQDCGREAADLACTIATFAYKDDFINGPTTQWKRMDSRKWWCDTYGKKGNERRIDGGQILGEPTCKNCPQREFLSGEDRGTDLADLYKEKHWEKSWYTSTIYPRVSRIKQGEYDYHCKATFWVSCVPPRETGCLTQDDGTYVCCTDYNGDGDTTDSGECTTTGV